MWYIIGGKTNLIWKLVAYVPQDRMAASPVTLGRLLDPKNARPVCGHLPQTLWTALEANTGPSSLQSYNQILNFTHEWIEMDWNTVVVITEST